MSNNKQPLAGLITAKLTPVFLSVGETPILCRGMPPARSPTLTRAGILFSNGEYMAQKQKTLHDYTGYFQHQPNGEVLIDPNIKDVRKELGHKNFWRVLDYVCGRMSFYEIEQLETGMIDVHTMRTQFEKNKKSIYNSIKKNGEFCKNCGTKKNLTIDHIIPLSKGGSNDEDNFQILCMSCNRKKGAR